VVDGGGILQAKLGFIVHAIVAARAEPGRLLPVVRRCHGMTEGGMI